MEEAYVNAVLQNRELQQQNKQLIEALEWYADHTNYHPYRFMSEDGKRARAALRKDNANEKQL